MVIVDLTTNEFDNRKYEFNMRMTINWEIQCYMVLQQWSKVLLHAGEMSNGTLGKKSSITLKCILINANTI